MFEVIKNVINAGEFKLADIQEKIKRMYLLGDISEEQFNELLFLSAEKVSIDAERPEMLAILKTLNERLKTLEDRISALEMAEKEDEQPENPEGEVIAPVYEKWAPWDGISNKYQPGAVVEHNGKIWQSIYSGQNVWEPGTIGTGNMWVEYVVEPEVEPEEPVEIPIEEPAEEPVE